MLETWIRESLNANSRMNFACLELSEVCGLPEDPLVTLSLTLMTGGMPKMPSGNLMVKMDGGLSYHTTPEVEVVVAVVGVVDVLVLI